MTSHSPAYGDVTVHPDTDAVVADLVARQVLEARDGATMERLAELEAKVTANVRASRAESTLEAYASDWADFTTWCKTIGLTPLPAAPGTVAAYLADMADPPDDREPLAHATIVRRKASIGEAHKLAGHPNPCADELVKLASKGIRRQIGVAPQHRKAGVSTADMRAIVVGLDTERLIDVRDKALLLVGYATALRRTSLVGLDVGDIEDHPQGMLVHLRRSKTDQEGAGARIEVEYGTNPETCPVRAYRTWTKAAGIVEGPVFRAVNRGGNISPNRLSGKAVALIIKKHAARIGKDPADFAGHSLRRGFATEAARQGASERTIAHTTQHTSTKGLSPYIEDAEVFTDPPSRYLGL